MYNLPAENADVPCPRCRRVMIDLSTYIQTDDDPGLDARDVGRASSIGDAVFRFALDITLYAMASAFRRFRRRRFYRRDLAEYPNSLICPICQHLLRRA